MQIFNADNLSFIMLGFAKTLEISFFAVIFSIILGTVLAMIKQYCRGRLRPFSILVSAYIELFRCTPNLLWILFIYFTVKGDDVVISVLAFTVFTNADGFVSTYGYLQGYILACAMYFIICFPLALLVQRLERRSKLRPRAKVIPGVTDVAAKEA